MNIKINKEIIKITRQIIKFVKQNNQPKIITEAQRKRLFAIGNSNNELIKNVIGRYGYTKTEQIKASDYEKICTEIESEILM